MNLLNSSVTSNQNNCNRMVSTSKRIYRRIRKLQSSYTKAIIRLRLNEYCWIILSTLSRKLFIMIFTEPEASNC